MLKRLPGDEWALVCDVCGLQGLPYLWPSFALQYGIAEGWEVIHAYATCPHCTETGAMASEEWVGDIRVTLPTPDDGADVALIARGTPEVIEYEAIVRNAIARAEERP